MSRDAAFASHGGSVTNSVHLTNARWPKARSCALALEVRASLVRNGKDLFRAAPKEDKNCQDTVLICFKCSVDAYRGGCKSPLLVDSSSVMISVRIVNSSRVLEENWLLSRELGEPSY